MKYWLSYNLLLLLLFFGMKAEAVAPAGADAGKRILVINSYSEQMTWSKRLTDSLENKIREVHPDWIVHTGDLKTESATYASAAALTLRSILWGYAERTQTDVDATSLKMNTLFVQDDIPDAIVWVGEEGFMHYMSYAFELGKWKHVPMVLCAVRDSVSAYGWFPEVEFRFDRKYGIRDCHVVIRQMPANHPYVKRIREDKDIHVTGLQEEGMCQLSVNLNYSGSVVNLPIRRNLELIQHLLPGLKELIWVDNSSYRSMGVRLEVEKLLAEILPDVKYSKMIHNRMNTDSIYDVMLEPVKDRAFLTYSWNINAFNSKRSGKQIDSLFTRVSSVPLFTLTERDFSEDNYWIGGCFLRQPKLVNQTLLMLERAVKGDSMMALPFDTLSESRTVLNRTALQRYGLIREADKLEGVSYVHIPPTFLHKYERQLLIAVLVLAAVLCYIIIGCRRSRYNKRLRADSSRYKRLYDKLQVIYANSSMDFALYDEDGKRLLRIVNGEVNPSGEYYDLFCEDIFESPFLSSHLKEQIRRRQVVNSEVAIDSTGKLSRTSFAGHSIYQLIVKPLHEVNYRTSCFMAIAINLTPVIRERREKERFEGLFNFASDSSQVGVAFYDAKTAVGMATDSWCRNMGEEFISGTFPSYEPVVAEDRQDLLMFQQEIRSGRVREILCKDIRLTRKDGKLHWTRQHIYFIPSSNRLIELSLDIDEQKQNEERLKEAKQKAEEAHEATRNFLSSVSHEVRTPLNSIVGFSAILTDSADEETTREYAPIILRNICLFDNLITNILDLSVLDSGKVMFRYARINIADIFIDMEAYIRNNLYNHPLRVIRELPECEAERLMVTDEAYLRLLLLNLLSNAVKFTESGCITLGCRKENGGFYFYIIDTGCGIAPEDQPHIFNRFVKLNAYIQGTGLGLSLCKSIVKHFNGEIGVISEKGKGSTFWFVLPDVRL